MGPKTHRSFLKGDILGGHMFQELSSEMKEHIVSNGEISFVPIRDLQKDSLISYAEHSIIFANKSGIDDWIGRFFLSGHVGYFYTLAKLEITAPCSDGLKIFLFELICKKALAEAVSMKARRLNIESEDPLSTEAFLTCKLGVKRINRSGLFLTPLFQGYRLLVE